MYGYIPMTHQNGFQREKMYILVEFNCKLSSTERESVRLSETICGAPLYKFCLINYNDRQARGSRGQISRQDGRKGRGRDAARGEGRAQRVQFVHVRETNHKKTSKETEQRRCRCKGVITCRGKLRLRC